LIEKFSKNSEKKNMKIWAKKSYPIKNEKIKSLHLALIRAYKSTESNKIQIGYNKNPISYKNIIIF